MGVKAPCKNCSNRHRACHDTCPRYKEFIAEKTDINYKKKQYYMERSTMFRPKTSRKRGYDGMMRAFNTKGEIYGEKRSD